MEYTFDQVAELLDEIAEGFPPIFFHELNGGILLQEEEKQSPANKGGGGPESRVLIIVHTASTNLITYVCLAVT